jgi:hypothetical protein
MLNQIKAPMLRNPLEYLNEDGPQDVFGGVSSGSYQWPRTRTLDLRRKLTQEPRRREMWDELMISLFLFRCSRTRFSTWNRHAWLRWRRTHLGPSTWSIRKTLEFNEKVWVLMNMTIAFMNNKHDECLGLHPLGISSLITCTNIKNLGIRTVIFCHKST